MKTLRCAILAGLCLLLCSAPALAAGGGAGGGSMGLTLLGGYAWPTASDAMSGRDGYSGPASSSFKDAGAFGAEAVYRLPVGLAFGVGLQYFKLTADAARRGNSETDFANLKSLPVYALARYTLPIQGRLSGHLEAGLGYAFNDAGKESGIEAMEAGLGQSVSIEAKNGVCGFVGAGADWSLSPSWSLGLGLRYWWLQSDYEMKTAGLGTFEKGTFQADNLQALLSLTYWFSF